MSLSGPCRSARSGPRRTSRSATNYQDVWWAADAGEVGLGSQLHAPGRYDLRDLVHLRCRRRAAMVVRHGAPDRLRCLSRDFVSHDGTGFRCAIVRFGDRPVRAGGRACPDLRRRESRHLRLRGDARLPSGRRERKQAAVAAGVPRPGHGLSVIGRSARTACGVSGRADAPVPLQEERRTIGLTESVRAPLNRLEQDLHRAELRRLVEEVVGATLEAR